MKRKKLVVKILNHIAEKGEAYQSNMSKDLDTTYSSLIRQLHFLKKQGYIKIVRKEKSSKKGKEKHVYGLTLQGLHLLLTANFEKNDFIGKIMENSPKLLLTSKKWKLFKKAGLTNIMLNCIKETVLSSVCYAAAAESLGAQVHLTNETNLRKTLDMSILYTPLFGIAESRDKLKKIYRSDIELLQFINKCFKTDERVYNKFQDVNGWWKNE